MVARDHDHDDGEHRIEDREHLRPAMLHAWREHERAPCRPRDVHARHRRVLVRDLAHCARVERPERRVLRERVDESVSSAGREQARRHEREQHEADEREQGGDRERVAVARVVVAELAEQVDAGRDRDDEVQRAVEVVRGDDERLEVLRPVLERLLVVDAEVALPADDVLGVVEARGSCRPCSRSGSPSTRSRRRGSRGSRPTSRACCRR